VLLTLDSVGQLSYRRTKFTKRGDKVNHFHFDAERQNNSINHRPDRAPRPRLRIGAAHVIACLATAQALLVFGNAAAQEQQSTETGQKTTEKLQEVVVTAQKRAEDVQKVPISIQVIDSQYLQDQNRDTLETLTQTVPGVHISSNAGQGGADMFIRGIGSGPNPFFESSVATFIDDIYLGRGRASAATFVDVDRIEILKGPQTTYFGNNAIAGALNIVSKQPTDTFEAWGRANYGQFGQYAAEGAVSGPVTDWLSARVAGTANGSTGYIYDVNQGKHVPDINNTGGRLTLLFHPNESFNATLKTEASRHKESGADADAPIQWINCPPPAPFTPTFNGFCNLALTLNEPIGLNNDETSQLPGQGNYLSTYENVLTMNLHEWGNTFTSVTGYYRHEFGTNDDGEHLPQYLVTGQVFEHYNQFSQELRMTSPTGRPIEYMLGAYYHHETLDSSIDVNLPAFGDLGIALLAPYTPLADNPQITQRESTSSVFGSLSWNISDQWKANAGLRGTWVHKDQVGVSYLGTAGAMYGDLIQLPPAIVQALPFVVAVPQEFFRSDKAWQPSAGVQYQINPDVMSYFTYSRGFKAGGLNGLDPFTPGDTTFGPEHVNDYELGIKSKWLNDTLLVNANVFRSDYKDLQVQFLFQTALNQFTLRTANAASSRAQGVELETQWKATRDFKLTANLTYLEAIFVDYPAATTTTLENFCAGNPAVPQCISDFPNGAPPFDNESGSPLPYSPRWSASATASYGIPLPSGYQLTTELSPYFTTDYFINGSTRDPYNRENGYTRLDGRLSFGKPGGHWTIQLIGQNLTDKVIANPVNLYYARKEAPTNFVLQFTYVTGGT
jgi:iron complex outermembrane receptor protein